MKKIVFAFAPMFLLLASCQGNDATNTSSSSQSGNQSEQSSSASKESSEEDNIKFEIGISGEEAVLKSVSGSSSVVNIPSSYEGKPLTRILEKAFFDKSKIKEINIPEGVREIGKDAFNGCTNLTKLSLPSSLRTIGERAFVGLRYIQKISIPEGVETIGGVAFSSCENLEEITFPSTLESLGSNLFTSKKLKTTTYKGLEYLGNEDNPYLVAYKVEDKNAGPEEIETHPQTKLLGCSIFESEKSLAKATLNEGLITIGASAFKSTIIENITIPSSVKTIEAYSFESCNKLTTCIISGNSLRKIEHEAFSGASALESISLPSSVEEVGFYAFSQFDVASSLKYNEKDNGYYLGNDNDPYHVFIGLKDKTVSSFTLDADTAVISGQAFRDSKLESLTIPTKVKTIGDSAFFQMTSLKEITIPSNVTNMGGNLFNSCSSLTKIELQNAPAIIGNGFAGNCAKLTTFVIPDSVVTLESNLFDRDESLEELIIPSNVLEAKDNAISNCQKLTIKVLNDSDPYLFSENWYNGIKDIQYGYKK